MKKREIKRTRQWSIFVLIAALLVCQPAPVSAANPNSGSADAVATSDMLEGRDADILEEECSIMTKTGTAELDLDHPECVTFVLERDSRVVFSAEYGSFWGLDQVVDPGGLDNIYLHSDSHEEFTLKKGVHRMYLVSIVGNWESNILTYTVYPTCNVYSVRGNNIESVFQYILQEKSEKSDIPQSSLKGYTFGGWFTDKECTTEITSVDKSIGRDWYVYPKLTPVKYQVTYELDGGVNDTANPQFYTIEDANITLAPATKKGYDFVRWYTLSGGKKKDVTEIDTAQCKKVNVYAEWLEHEYQITYVDAYDHSNPSTYRITDPIIKLKDPVRPGYEFQGWYTDAGCTEEIDAVDCKKSENLTLYARWEAVPYSIHYELNGGVNAAENKTEYTVENIQELENPTKEDYKFDGWYLDETFKTPVTELAKAEGREVTLYAKWLQQLFSVTYVDGGTHENPSSYTEEDETILLADGERDGYRFAGWYLDQGYTQKITEIDTGWKKDIILYAKWLRQSFSVTYVDGGTHENPSSYTEEDGTILLADGERDGYCFAGWYLDQGYAQKITEIDTGQKKDITLYGAWDLNTYHVTYELNGGINADQNITEFTIEDSDFILLEPTKSDCIFDGWYILLEDGSFSEKIEKISTECCTNLTLAAKWKEREDCFIETKTGIAELNLDDPEYVTIDLERDSRVVFSSKHSSFWGLDQVVPSGSHESIYLLKDKEVFLEKGTHRMYLLYIPSNEESDTLAYTIYPKCGIYYVYENQAKQLDSYYLQSSPSQLTLKMPEIKGYRTIALYRDRDKTSVIESVDKSVGKDWYVYPELDPIVYSVTYDMDGGVNAEGNIISYTVEDEDFVLQDPQKEGYVFEGWYTSPALTGKVEKIVTETCGNVTLYAKWKKEIPAPTPVPTPTPKPEQPPSAGPGESEEDGKKQEEENKINFQNKKITIYPCEMADNQISFPKRFGKAVNWNVRNPKIVKIKKSYRSGKVYFVGLKAGKTRISVSIGGAKYGFDIVVRNPKAFQLKRKKITAKVGASAKNVYRTQSKDARGYDQKMVKINISNKKVARITATKGYISIKGKAKGRTKVTVKVGKKKAVFWVIVK